MRGWLSGCECCLDDGAQLVFGGVRGEHRLSHQHAHEVVDRVGPERGCRRATPAVFAGRARGAGRVEHDGGPEPEPMAGHERVEQLELRGSEVVAVHQPDGVFGEHAVSVELAAAGQHLREAQEVTDG